MPGRVSAASKPARIASMYSMLSTIAMFAMRPDSR